MTNVEEPETPESEGSPLKDRLELIIAIMLGLRAIRGLLRTFDPDGLLNPGKLVP